MFFPKKKVFGGIFFFGERGEQEPPAPEIPISGQENGDLNPGALFSLSGGTLRKRKTRQGEWFFFGAWIEKICDSDRLEAHPTFCTKGDTLAPAQANRISPGCPSFLNK
jgi:hypothetical protein